MYLIDGYNLMYQTDCWNAEQLVEELNTFCGCLSAGRFKKRKKARVFFDGYCSNDLSTFNVEVFFSGDADEKLIDYLQNLDNPSQYVLITSDREIVDVARERKIQVIKSEDFDFSLPTRQTWEKEDDPLLTVGAEEVNDLLKQFREK